MTVLPPDSSTTTVYAATDQGFTTNHHSRKFRAYHPIAFPAFTRGFPAFPWRHGVSRVVYGGLWLWFTLQPASTGNHTVPASNLRYSRFAEPSLPTRRREPSATSPRLATLRFAWRRSCSSRVCRHGSSHERLHAAAPPSGVLSSFPGSASGRRSAPGPWGFLVGFDGASPGVFKHGPTRPAGFAALAGQLNARRLDASGLKEVLLQLGSSWFKPCFQVGFGVPEAADQRSEMEHPRRR